jgi:hypothetical protein
VRACGTALFVLVVVVVEEQQREVRCDILHVKCEVRVCPLTVFVLLRLRAMLEALTGATPESRHTTDKSTSRLSTDFTHDLHVRPSRRESFPLQERHTQRPHAVPLRTLAQVALVDQAALQRQERSARESAPVSNQRATHSPLVCAHSRTEGSRTIRPRAPHRISTRSSLC